MPRVMQKICGKENNKIMKFKDKMGYEQPITLFSHVNSRLPLGALPNLIQSKKPIHGLKLIFATAVWLILLKHANTVYIKIGDTKFHQAHS